MKIITDNKKAYHEYTVIERYEVGINLVGSEVKSLRCGEVSMSDSYCDIKGNELFLNNCYIKKYDKGSFFNVEEKRSRRLLMHKNEILRLLSKVREKGYTLVPTKMYFVGSLVKVEVALAKGKKLYDKKQAKMEQDVKRYNDRELRDITRQ